MLIMERRITRYIKHIPAGLSKIFKTVFLFIAVFFAMLVIMLFLCENTTCLTNVTDLSLESLTGMEIFIESMDVDIFQNQGIEVKNIRLSKRNSFVIKAKRITAAFIPANLFKNEKPYLIELIEPSIYGDITPLVNGGMGFPDELHIPRVTFRNLAGDVLYRDSRFALDGVFSGSISLYVDERVLMYGKLEFAGTRFIFNENIIFIDGMLRMQRDQVSIRKLSAEMDGQELKLRGLAKIDKKISFNGDLAIRGLRIRKGPGNDELFSPGVKEFISTKLSLYTRLQGEDISFYGIPVTRLSARVDLENGIFSVEELDIRGPGLSVTGEFKTGLESVEYYDITFAVREILMSKLLSPLEQRENVLEGTVTASGAVTGTADSINGQINFSSRNGVIQRFALVSKLFTLLNATRLFNLGGSGLLEKRTFYDSIYIKGTIKNNVFYFTEGSVTSPSLQVALEGMYNIMSNSLNLVIGVYPLDTADRIIRTIPILGHILTGSERGFFAVYFRARGPLDDVNVWTVPVKNLSEKVVGITRRVFLLPYTLVAEPEELLPEFD